MAKRFYVIYDAHNKTHIGIDAYVGNDILGYVVSYAERKNAKIDEMRLYEFSTKKARDTFLAKYL